MSKYRFIFIFKTDYLIFYSQPRLLFYKKPSTRLNFLN